MLGSLVFLVKTTNTSLQENTYVGVYVLIKLTVWLFTFTFGFKAILLETVVYKWSSKLLFWKI